MKRFFAFAGLMTAAAITLTNCQPKEASIDAPAQGRTVLISVSTDAGTKTENDGMSTLWADGDAINLFYSEGSGYQNLGQVTIAGGIGTSRASFEVSGAPEGSVKWYALYPYGSHIETPGSRTDGYVYVGDTRGLNQTGFDSMAALCGSACPLYGIAEGVAEDVIIPMKHLASAIEFNLTNNNAKAIDVTKLTLTASEDIIGSYYITFDSDSPEYEPSRVQNTAFVNLTDATLAAGASGKVYLAVKPYTQSSSEAFKVTVNYVMDGVAKSQVVELNPTGAQAVFTAGKIKKVNVGVKAEQDEPGVTTVSTMMQTYAEENGCTISAGTDVVMYKVLDLSEAVRMSTTGDDNCGSFWFTSGTQWRLYQNKGGNVKIEVASGCNLKSIKFTFAATNGGVLRDSGGNPVESDETIEASGTSAVFTVGNSGDATNGQIRITAVEIKYTGDGTLGPVVEPKLSVDPESIDFEASASSATVSVTSDDSGWTVDNSSTDSWLTVTKSGSKVSVSAAENTGGKRKTTFVVKHASASLTATVTVNQAAGESASDKLAIEPRSLIIEADDTSEHEVTVTTNLAGWTWDTETVPSWLTVSKSGDILKVKAAANTGDARSCTIKVIHANGTPTANLVVNQKAPSSGVTVTYTKVTSNSQITSGDYLIVYEDGANSVAIDGSLTEFGKENWMSVTISGNTITTDDGTYLTYDASAETLKSASGLYFESANAGKNGLYTSPTIQEQYADNFVITLSYSGGVGVVGCNLSDGLHQIRWNASEKYFRFYRPGSSIVTDIQLYKKN